MGQLSPKLRSVEGGHAHWCPGCEEMHSIAVSKPLSNGARWSFDGNLQSPSFTPSVNITVGPDEDGKIERCHYVIKAGRIQFVGDCTHHLKGQTVDLPDLPQHLRD